jgi:hypothetical protein
MEFQALEAVKLGLGPDGKGRMNWVEEKKRLI